MSCGIQQNKNIVYILNFILAVCGIISLAVGVILRTKAASGKAARVTIAADILIVIGCLLFFLSIFGFFAYRYNKHYIFFAYACLLTALMVAQITVAITVLVQSQKGASIQSFLESVYTTFFKYYWTDQSIGISIDDIQVDYQCCGIENAEDFIRLGNVIPGSCCGKLSLDICPSFVLYRKGCLTELKEFVVWSGSVCGGIVLGIAAFELVDIVLAFMLANAMWKAQRGEYMY